MIAWTSTAQRGAPGLDFGEGHGNQTPLLFAILRESKEFRSGSQLHLQFHVDLQRKVIIHLHQGAFGGKRAHPPGIP